MRRWLSRLLFSGFARLAARLPARFVRASLMRFRFRDQTRGMGLRWNADHGELLRQRGSSPWRKPRPKL